MPSYFGIPTIHPSLVWSTGYLTCILICDLFVCVYMLGPGFVVSFWKPFVVDPESDPGELGTDAKPTTSWAPIDMVTTLGCAQHLAHKSKCSCPVLMTLWVLSQCLCHFHACSEAGSLKERGELSLLIIHATFDVTVCNLAINKYTLSPDKRKSFETTGLGKGTAACTKKRCWPVWNFLWSCERQCTSFITKWSYLTL